MSMSMRLKTVLFSGMAWWLTVRPARAQATVTDLVFGFSGILIAVSALLIAVGTVFVLIKVARLLDLLERRFRE